MDWMDLTVLTSLNPGGRCGRSGILRHIGRKRSGLNPPVHAVSDTEPCISLLTIELLIPWAQSLKDKRSAVRGLKERLRSRFNASVAEVDHHDKWQRAVIAVCIVGNKRRQLEADMGRVRQLCEEARDLQVADVVLHWL
jgi:uncharacterized protein